MTNTETVSTERSAIDLRLQLAMIAPKEAAALWAVPNVISYMNEYIAALTSRTQSPAEWQVEAAKWLDEAAGYFERRPTDGEDMAFWANVTNAKFCQGLAARLRAASIPAPEHDHTTEYGKALDAIRRKAIAFGTRATDGYAEIQSIACDALNVALTKPPAPERSKEETGVLSVPDAMAQLAAAIEAEKRRNAVRDEMLATVIVNLEKSEMTAEFAVLLRDYVRAERAKLSALETPLRAEIGRANDFWREQVAAPAPAPVTISRDDLAEIISKAGSPPRPPDGPVGALPDGHVLRVQAYKQADAVLAALAVPVPVTITDEMANAAIARSKQKDLDLLTNTEAMRQIIAAALSLKPGEQG